MARMLTSHKTSNDDLEIEVVDEPGNGGANHAYEISHNGRRLGFVHFQNGPVEQAGFNGVTNEALLAIVEDRLKGFQGGPLKCEANEASLTSIREAINKQVERTLERRGRGVEGTDKP